MDYASLDKMPSVSEEPELPMPTGTEVEPDDTEASGELTDEQRLLAKTLGMKPSQAVALKDFIESCMSEGDDYE